MICDFSLSVEVDLQQIRQSVSVILNVFVTASTNQLVALNFDSLTDLYSGNFSLEYTYGVVIIEYGNFKVEKYQHLYFIF